MVTIPPGLPPWHSAGGLPLPCGRHLPYNWPAHPQYRRSNASAGAGINFPPKTNMTFASQPPMRSYLCPRFPALAALPTSWTAPPQTVNKRPPCLLREISLGWRRGEAGRLLKPGRQEIILLIFCTSMIPLFILFAQAMLGEGWGRRRGYAVVALKVDIIKFITISPFLAFLMYNIHITI